METPSAGVPHRMVAEKHIAAFTADVNKVDLFIANAPFMSITQMTALFKCYDYVIMAIAHALKIPINEPYAEIPLACIVARLGVIPPEAVVKTVSQGTLVILPPCGKYLRTVHHFSAGVVDDRTAIDGYAKDLPTHLKTRLWL